jgi:hypothetical protein
MQTKRLRLRQPAIETILPTGVAKRVWSYSSDRGKLRYRRPYLASIGLAEDFIRDRSGCILKKCAVFGQHREAFESDVLMVTIRCTALK